MLKECDCGQEARLGGYCSKQCELKAVIRDHHEAQETRRWPTRGDGGQCGRRVQDKQYHGQERRDDI